MGIYGIKREEVKDIRRKRTLKTLKQKRKEAEEKRELAKLEQKRKRAEATASVYEARARKKKAKREAGFRWPILPTAKVKVRKKKQGKKLSKKKRIGLI